jgi:hypothetical protein
MAASLITVKQPLLIFESNQQIFLLNKVQQKILTVSFGRFSRYARKTVSSKAPHPSLRDTFPRRGRLDVSHVYAF